MSLRMRGALIAAVAVALASPSYAPASASTVPTSASETPTQSTAAPSSAAPSPTALSSTALSPAAPNSTAISSTAISSTAGAAPIRGVRDATQLIVVTSKSWKSTWATLRTYEKRNGRWVAALPAMPARIGSSGFVIGSTRRQATGATPAGTYALGSAFGGLASPGGSVPYRRITPNSWWPYDPRDPATYNVFQTRKDPQTRWRTSRSEHLIKLAPTQYRHALVIGYNMPAGTRYDPARGQRVGTTPVNTARGGGIFLHVAAPRPTAGCVALSLANMRSVLRWLKPSARPLIAMGPQSYVATL